MTEWTGKAKNKHFELLSIFLVYLESKNTAFLDCFQHSVPTHYFYKDTFYRNIDAEICEIMSIL